MKETPSFFCNIPLRTLGTPKYHNLFSKYGFISRKRLCLAIKIVQIFRKIHPLLNLYELSAGLLNRFNGFHVTILNVSS